MTPRPNNTNTNTPVHETEHPVVKTEKREHRRLDHPTRRPGRLCQEHFQGVEDPDDDVLEPKQENQGEDFPAQ